MNYPNFHIITVKYFGATNHQGSRIKITSDRFKASVTIPYDYSTTSIEKMATDYLEKKGFNIIGISSGYVISDTFDSVK